jgi:translation elongation factor EF-Tu-like GTPase
VTGTDAAAEDFRFVVKEAFTLTGRGTTVVGRIEAGVVHVGDLLRLEREGNGRTFACEGISGVRVADWHPDEPATVALLVPSLDKTDIQPGDVFLVNRE